MSSGAGRGAGAGGRIGAGDHDRAAATKHDNVQRGRSVDDVAVSPTSHSTRVPGCDTLRTAVSTAVAVVCRSMGRGERKGGGARCALAGAYPSAAERRGEERRRCMCRARPSNCERLRGWRRACTVVDAHPRVEQVPTHGHHVHANHAPPRDDAAVRKAGAAPRGLSWVPVTK